MAPFVFKGSIGLQMLPRRRLYVALPQVSQIGLSACGATAVINALLALDSPHTTATVAAQERKSVDIQVLI